MNKMRSSTTGLLVAFFIAACGSDTSSQSGSGGSSTYESGGAGGEENGGAGGNENGGAGGNESGGTSGSENGGVGGNDNGGAAGNDNGGAGGAAGKGGTTSASGQGGSSVLPAGGAKASGGQPAGGSPGAGGTTQPGSGGTTPPPPPQPKLVTSAKDAYWKESTWTEVSSGNADVTVNDTKTHQTWAGFGGTFNEAGWDALSVLSDKDRDRAIKLLFDAAEGANFAFGRVPIGASDYAMDRYSLNETKDDFEMTSFSIERDKKMLIPYIKAALAIKPDIHFWASPWTPPTWMKNGSFTANGMTGWDGGNMKDDDKVLKAHALYLAKFVEEYGKVDIKIEAIHPQNEPGYDTRYPSCLWSASLFNKFIKSYLGPTFEERKVPAQIYLGTMSNNDSGKDGTIISTVTGDSATMKYVKGAGLQWNMISYSGNLANKGLQVVQSEHKCGNYHWNPSGFPPFNPDKPPNDHAYGVESWGYIKDWIKAGVHVYSAWNMVLDLNGKNLDTQRPWPQNALLVVDRGAKSLIQTPAYYVFRHFSQFVDPGAKVVDTSGGDAMAFKNPDGSIVAVMYASSGKSNYTVKVGGKMVQFNMPGDGWATVNWEP